MENNAQSTELYELQRLVNVWTLRDEPKLLGWGEHVNLEAGCRYSIYMQDPPSIVLSFLQLRTQETTAVRTIYWTVTGKLYLQRFQETSQYPVTLFTQTVGYQHQCKQT